MAVKIYYQNVRGLRTKAAQFYESILEIGEHIFCLTETWLNNSCYTFDYFTPDFDVFRNDRSEVYAKRGGGVLIAIPKRLRAFRRGDLEYLDISVWVEFVCDGSHFLVGVFYFVPNTNVDVFDHCFNACRLGLLAFVGDMYLFGDFNLPKADWNMMDFSKCTSLVKDSSCCLVNFVTLLGLSQLNCINNSNFDMLDLCFSNVCDFNTVLCSSPLVPLDPYHPAFTICMLGVEFSFETPPSVPFLDFEHGDYLRLYENLASVDWSKILLSSDLNFCVAFFTHSFQEVIKDCVPLRRGGSKKFPSWFSIELRNELRAKRRLHRKYKRTHLDTSYREFAAARLAVKQLLLRDREVHFVKIANSVKTNPCAFWKFMKPRYRQSGFDIMLSHNETVITDGLKIGSVFCDYFASVSAGLGDSSHTRPQTDLSYLQSVGVDSLDVPIVTDTMIIAAAKCLKPKKTCGVDEIPPFILKACISILTQPLAHLFNLSVRNGIFPDAWKTAIISPVFKSGSRLKVENYRPISNLCAVSKLFEYVIYLWIVPWSTSFLSDNQFGFTSGRSVETNLLTMLCSIAPSVLSREQFDVVYLDFSKAFDRVNHDLLLDKLAHYGISPSFLPWFASYLKNRSNFVRCRGIVSSRSFDTPSGVPQGSVLGPLLFKIFINDLDCLLSSVIRSFFADDSKLGHRIITVSDCWILQRALDSVCRWSVENCMNLNVLKSVVVSYTRKTDWIRFDYSVGGILIPRKKEQRDLGVFFDRKLLFRAHVDRVIGDCNRYLGLIFRLSTIFTSAQPLRLLYLSLVRSRLTFSSIVWSGCARYLIDRLEGVEKRFAFLIYQRFLLKESPEMDYNYKAVLDSLNIPTLKCMFLLIEFTFLHRLLNGNLCAPSLLNLINIRVPRGGRRFELFYNDKVTHPISRITDNFNKCSFDCDIFNSSLNEFRLAFLNYVDNV